MYEFLDYLVEDTMSRRVIQISPDAPLSELEALFEKHAFNGVPVVESGRIAGWVTKLDVLKAFRFTDDHMFPPYEEIMTWSVSRVMVENVASVNPRTPLTRVLEDLVRDRCKSFPVLEDHRVVGIVSREDVLRALRRAAAGERPPTPAGDAEDEERG